jgi:hypothetical protein
LALAPASSSAVAARTKASEEPAHGDVVAEDGRGMNVAVGDLGMRGQDCLGALERPRSVPGISRNTRGFDERRPRIVQRGDGPLASEPFDVLCKLRPTLEAMLPRDDEVRIGKSKLGVANLRLRQLP